MKNSKDPRRAEITKHLRLLARRHNRPLQVQDYLEYRTKHAPHLPALATVYRLFGSWPAALRETGADGTSKSDLSRTSDEALIAALQQAARDLGVDVLSSHAYDEYRRNNDPSLPSSSVIRKWLGYWADAVQAAGLQAAERTTPRPPTLVEIIDSIRLAKGAHEGMLASSDYTEYRENLPPEERDRFPDLSQVMQQFPTWDAALRAADVEQSDAVHPHGLWTAEEARRIATQSERILGRPLDREGYMEIKRRASRPLPSWQVLSDLLQQ